MICTSTTRRSAIVVRETTCKTILNRSGIGDYCLNCYGGCTHGCVYCYARFMQRFHPHAEPWGQFVDVKVNAVEVLQRQLRRARRGEVFLSSVCDGWQPIEAERTLSRQCCQLLVQNGFRVSVLTKSALVLRDLDIFTGHRARIGVTVTTLDERLRELWEPGASRVEDRLRVIEAAHRRGLETSIMFGPLLPFLADDQASIEALFQRATDLAVDVMWVDALNLRSGVWPAVLALLREKFPELRASYGRLLFETGPRESYLAQLRKRVMQAVDRFSLQDRVTICF